MNRIGLTSERGQTWMTTVREGPSASAASCFTYNSADSLLARGASRKRHGGSRHAPVDRAQKIAVGRDLVLGGGELEVALLKIARTRVHQVGELSLPVSRLAVADGRWFANNSCRRASMGSATALGCTSPAACGLESADAASAREVPCDSDEASSGNAVTGGGDADRATEWIRLHVEERARTTTHARLSAAHANGR